jgi:hypothetical protein
MNKLTKFLILYTALFSAGCIACNAQQFRLSNNFAADKNQSGINSIATIDSGDSVFFDLINVTVTGNLLAVPVYMKSDDVINALDFKIKYNHDNLLFDSVQLISNCFDQTTYFESPFDSSVRFTSNSFQNYPSDTLLLNLYFNILGGVYNDSDFYNQTAFLNGITCTAHLVVPPPLSVSELNEIPNLKLYPNPVVNELLISGEKLTGIQIIDINGKLVDSYAPSFVFNDYRMDVSKLNQGSYVVKISSGKLIAIKQIVVSK